MDPSIGRHAVNHSTRSICTQVDRAERAGIAHHVRDATSVQVDPPLVLRYMVSLGHQWSIVITCD